MSTARTILITGGNSGIGLAAARRFLASGHRVGIVGRRSAAVATAVKELGSQALGFTADVAKLPDLDRLAGEVGSKLGNLDSLFVNAGLGEFRSLEQVDEAYYDQVMGVNLKGAFFTIQKLLPRLRNPSTIVLNTSVAGLKGFPNFSVYGASKAGLRALARSLSTELLARGIRVNAVAPGPIDTPYMANNGVPADAVPSTQEAFAQFVPLKRLGSADEVAAAVEFLAGPASSFVVGAELAVDGGLTSL